MSALPSGSGVAARLAPAKPKTRGFLHIVRHGAGPHAIYVVTYHRLGHDGPSAADSNRGHREHASLPSVSLPSAPIAVSAGTPPSKPVLAEGAPSPIALLERIGGDFRLGEVRGAL